MKKAIAVITVILAVIIAGTVTLICTCGKRNETYNGIVIDKTKTQLYVGNYDGGAGHEWLNIAIDGFEEEYKSESFEKGKTGVQVLPRNLKDEFMGTLLLENIADGKEDIVITGTISYADFVAADVLLDITDVVTAGGENSAEKRMNESMRRTFDMGTESQSKYYGVPTLASLSGIVYDVDLFEDEKLYFGEGSTASRPVWTGAENKSAGMDGEKGTYDDGLPETWEQLKVLMTRMVTKNITPFTWSGMYDTYRQRFMNYIWASYEGADDFLLNYSFSGTDSDSGDIDYSNGYLLQKQNGKYAALKVAEYIVKNSTLYSENAMKTSQSHSQAQTEYLTSVEKEKRIAMLLEGTWWENEARGTFDGMIKYSPDYAYGVRRFGYMPFPRFIGSAGIPDTDQSKTTLLCDAGSGAVIAKKNVDHPELVKKFIAYLLRTDTQAMFTATTGLPMPYSYSLTEDQYASMTNYARTIWDLVTSEDAELVYPVYDTPIRIENTTFFSNWDWGANVTINKVNQTVNEPMMTFYSYPTITAEDYFSGLSRNFSSAKWQELSNYFN